MIMSILEWHVSGEKYNTAPQQHKKCEWKKLCAIGGGTEKTKATVIIMAPKLFGGKFKRLAAITYTNIICSTYVDYVNNV